MKNIKILQKSSAFFVLTLALISMIGFYSCDKDSYDSIDIQDDFNNSLSSEQSIENIINIVKDVKNVDGILQFNDWSQFDKVQDGLAQYDDSLVIEALAHINFESYLELNISDEFEKELNPIQLKSVWPIVNENGLVYIGKTLSQFKEYYSILILDGDIDKIDEQPSDIVIKPNEEQVLDFKESLSRARCGGTYQEITTSHADRRRSRLSYSTYHIPRNVGYNVYEVDCYVNVYGQYQRRSWGKWRSRKTNNNLNVFFQCNIWNRTHSGSRTTSNRSNSNIQYTWKHTNYNVLRSEIWANRPIVTSARIFYSNSAGGHASIVCN